MCVCMCECVSEWQREWQRDVQTCRSLECKLLSVLGLCVCVRVLEVDQHLFTADLLNNALPVSNIQPSLVLFRSSGTQQIIFWSYRRLFLFLTDCFSVIMENPQLAASVSTLLSLPPASVLSLHTAAVMDLFVCMHQHSFPLRSWAAASGSRRQI